MNAQATPELAELRSRVIFDLVYRDKFERACSRAWFALTTRRRSLIDWLFAPLHRLDEYLLDRRDM